MSECYSPKVTHGIAKHDVHTLPVVRDLKGAPRCVLRREVPAGRELHTKHLQTCTHPHIHTCTHGSDEEGVCPACSFPHPPASVAFPHVKSLTGDLCGPFSAHAYRHDVHTHQVTQNDFSGHIHACHKCGVHTHQVTGDEINVISFALDCQLRHVCERIVWMLVGWEHLRKCGGVDVWLCA